MMKSMILRTLVLIALITSQLLVVGQALAIPDCHAGDPAVSVHAEVADHSSSQHPSEQQAECHCPQGQHCGLYAMAIVAAVKLQQPLPLAGVYIPTLPQDTAAAHRRAPDRPPSLPRA